MNISEMLEVNKMYVIGRLAEFAGAYGIDLTYHTDPISGLIVEMTRKWRGYRYAISRETLIVTVNLDMIIDSIIENAKLYLRINMIIILKIMGVIK